MTFLDDIERIRLRLEIVSRYVDIPSGARTELALVTMAQLLLIELRIAMPALAPEKRREFDARIDDIWAKCLEKAGIDPLTPPPDTEHADRLRTHAK